MDQALIDLILQEYLNNLQLELPDRIFTREWKGRERYQNSELQPGIFTLINMGSRRADLDDPYLANIRLMIIGRIYCGANATGLDVERAELKLEDEIRQFSEGNSGAALRILESVTSHQVETPHGWVVMECLSGPHDLHHSSLFDNGVPYEGTVLFASEPDIGPGSEGNYLDPSDDA